MLQFQPVLPANVAPTWSDASSDDEVMSDIRSDEANAQPSAEAILPVVPAGPRAVPHPPPSDEEATSSSDEEAPARSDEKASPSVVFVRNLPFTLADVDAAIEWDERNRLLECRSARTSTAAYSAVVLVRRHREWLVRNRKRDT